MVPEPTAGRPATGDGDADRIASDGRPVGERTDNPGRGDGLTAKLVAARDAAPDGADDLQIASVAWRAWTDERDPADVWEEVLAGG